MKVVSLGENTVLMVSERERAAIQVALYRLSITPLADIEATESPGLHESWMVASLMFHDWKHSV